MKFTFAQYLHSMRWDSTNRRHVYSVYTSFEHNRRYVLLAHGIKDSVWFWHLLMHWMEFWKRISDRVQTECTYCRSGSSKARIYHDKIKQHYPPSSFFPFFILSSHDWSACHFDLQIKQNVSPHYLKERTESLEENNKQKIIKHKIFYH